MICGNLRATMPPRAGTKLGVLASGRGSNFAALAEAAAADRLGGRIELLISDREQAAVLEKGREFGVPSLYLDPGPYRTRLATESEARYVETLRQHGVEVVLLAGFMRVLHEGFLDAFPGCILNVHPSLLPAFPGLNAARAALKYGVLVTGCTVHLVDDRVDGGPILAQRAVPVFSDDDSERLSGRIQMAEHRLYPATVHRFLTDEFHIENRRVIWEES